MALFDIVSDSVSISKNELISKLTAHGFENKTIMMLLDELKIHEKINIADLAKINYHNMVGIKPISITYPTYDNRGIPAKYLFNNVSSTTLFDIINMIFSATKTITILSPYIEEDGIRYLGEILKTKLNRSIDVKIIARELSMSSLRTDKLISWIKLNLSQYSNFSLYDYHHTSPGGHVNSTCHGKVVAVDNKIAYVGSADVRHRAFNLNFEIGTIHTGYVARAISSLLNEIVQVSEKYSL